MIRCAESLRVMRFYGRIGSGQLVDILAKQRRKRLQATLLKSVDEGFDGRHCLAGRRRLNRLVRIEAIVYRHD